MITKEVASGKLITFGVTVLDNAGEKVQGVQIDILVLRLKWGTEETWDF